MPPIAECGQPPGSRCSSCRRVRIALATGKTSLRSVTLFSRRYPLFLPCGGSHRRERSLPVAVSMPSMFGSQANSKRLSPPGTVFALPLPPRGAIHFTSNLGRLPPSKGPGPFEPGMRQHACGVQPLSVNVTNPSPSLPKDTRFGYIERFQRKTATPGPGTCARARPPPPRRKRPRARLLAVHTRSPHPKSVHAHGRRKAVRARARGADNPN
ncbi:hypothetical protein OAO87_01050 [bacterium]|nr:hypothetical protein [bacterium]